MSADRGVVRGRWRGQPAAAGVAGRDTQGSSSRDGPFVEGPQQGNRRGVEVRPTDGTSSGGGGWEGGVGWVGRQATPSTVKFKHSRRRRVEPRRILASPRPRDSCDAVQSGPAARRSPLLLFLIRGSTKKCCVTVPDWLDHEFCAMTTCSESFQEQNHVNCRARGERTLSQTANLVTFTARQRHEQETRARPRTGAARAQARGSSSFLSFLALLCWGTCCIPPPAAWWA